MVAAHIKQPVIQALSARGIPAETQQFFNIVADRGGFLYPTVDEHGKTRYRWKNADSSAKEGQKYIWRDNPNGKDALNTWQYYVSDDAGLRDAIKRIFDTVYWVAGEVEVWTMHAVGKSGKYPPAVAAFGEKNIPEGVTDWLKERGVKSVIYYPDLDETGFEAAAKLHILLKDSGISLELLQLPGEFGSKMDLNALWQQVNFEREKFWQVLKACKPIDGIEMWGEAPSVGDTQSDSSELEMKPEYYEAIAAALGVKKYRRNGFSYNVKCPFHDDENASGAWHKDKHFFKCFSCGTIKLAKETAQHVGVDYKQYLPERPVNYTPRSEAPRTDGNTAPKTAQESTLKVLPAAKESAAPAKRHLDEFVTGEQMLRMYEAAIDPETQPTLIPTLMPFTVLHRFGGFARFLPVGKMAGIAAQTGGNKTVFLETIADGYTQLGEDVLVYSPEWSPEEMGYRQGMRYGGASIERVFEHQVWKHYRNIGQRSPVPVYPLNSQERELSKQAIGVAMPFTGERYVLKRARIELDELLDTIEGAVNELRTGGSKARVLILDYLQVLKIAARDGKHRSLQDAIGMIKDLAIDCGLVVWAATQVTKESSRNKNSEGKLLDESSAQYVRFDEFNLAMTLNMNYFPDESEYLTNAGQHDGTATINVVKNSLGKRGKVTVKTDLQHLVWLDEEAIAQEWHSK